MLGPSDFLCRLERMERVAGDGDCWQMGKPVLSKPGYDCCGKPQGCSNMNPGCAYLEHPYKRWAREQMAGLKREGLLRA